MARRETYTVKIKCGTCNRIGQGTFTEDENPVYSRGQLDRVVDSVTEGFKLNSTAKFGIECDCGSLDVRQAS